MRGDAGEREEIVEREIAVADSIEAVCGDFREAEFVRDCGAVDGEGISGQRARAHGAGIGTRSGMP